MEICSTGLGIPKLGKHRVPPLHTGRTGVRWAAPTLDWTVMLHQPGRKHRNPIRNRSSGESDPPEEPEFLLCCPRGHGAGGWARAELLCLGTCPTPVGCQCHLPPPWGLFQSPALLSSGRFGPSSAQTPNPFQGSEFSPGSKAHPHPLLGQSTRSRKPPPQPPSPGCVFTPEGSSPFARPCSYKKKIYFQLSAASVARQRSRLHISPGSQLLSPAQAQSDV